MFRFIFYLLFTVVLISVLKAIMGIVTRGFGDAFKQSMGAPPARPTNQVPLSGELKKDPVCGTYISTATSVKERVGAETVHFCSPQCRDKYVATAAR